MVTLARKAILVLPHQRGSVIVLALDQTHEKFTNIFFIQGQMDYSVVLGF